MSGKEVIPFTVKGPIPVQLGEPHGSPSLGTGERTGAAVLDLNFTHPCQVVSLLIHSL